MATSIQTCYRHGDRRAGVRCQRCDRPICPDCMNQASVGFQCPDCSRAGAQRTYRPGQLPGRTTPVVTVTLIAISVAAFILEPFIRVRLGAGPYQRVSEAVGTEGGLLVIDQAFTQFGVLYGPNVAAGDWWRTITSGFLHADILHLGMNMLLLFLLGQMLEPALNRAGLLSLYAMSLLGGSLAVLLISPDNTTLGASGAVFGLMGAAFVGLRSRGINPFNTIIGPLLVINVVFSFTPGISIGGHLGGLAAGAAGGWLLFEAAPRLPSGKRLMPLACTGITVALFLLCLTVPGGGSARLLAPVIW